MLISVQQTLASYLLRSHLKGSPTLKDSSLMMIGILLALNAIVKATAL